MKKSAWGWGYDDACLRLESKLLEGNNDIHDVTLNHIGCDSWIYEKGPHSRELDVESLAIGIQGDSHSRRAIIQASRHQVYIHCLMANLTMYKATSEGMSKPKYLGDACPKGVWDFNFEPRFHEISWRFQKIFEFQDFKFEISIDFWRFPEISEDFQKFVWFSKIS